MSRLARTLDSRQDRYDVIVVGSGYGGGVAASRLARAGKRVAVLERGREFLTGEFPGRFPDLRNELQVRGRRVAMGRETALYDVRLGEDMHVLVGCGLGGGSLVNAGVALEPDPRVLVDEAWPDEIAQDGLIAEGYRRARRWLSPASDPRAAEHAKFNALAAAGRAVSAEPVAPPVVVAFEETVNAAGVAQPACTRCGDCCGGCNVGAKNTVALTYLPDAVRHGAHLFTQAMVRSLSRRPDGSWQVDVIRPDEAGAREAPIAMAADLVVLAAGTLGSTEILLRSRAGGLALSPRLGERFSANGDIIAFGYGANQLVNAIGVGHPPRVELEACVGACVSGQIELRDPADLTREVTVQEGVLPSALAPVLPVMFVPNGRLLGALQSLVSGVYKGPFARLQTFFAVSHDSSGGRLVLDGERVALSWPGAAREPVYQRLDAVLSRLVGEVGGSYVKNPLSGTLMGHQPATAHPLGGCILGRDRTGGVVNHKGQVFDGHGAGATDVHTGLYVMDGSVIPRSLGVNPLLTITALAERAMLHMARDLGLAFDDRPIPVATPATPAAPGGLAPV